MERQARRAPLKVVLLSVCLLCFKVFPVPDISAYAAAGPPVPLLNTGHPVKWWFVFKFNTAAFPGCGAGVDRQCTFGGDVQDYSGGFGQQFVYASRENGALQNGSSCVGESSADPVGA